jgi:ferredoxin
MTNKYKITIKDFHKDIIVEEGQTILEAMEGNKIDMKSDCRSGLCGTCKAKLIKGEVENSEADALSENEVKNGYILTCVAYPKSDCEIILLGKTTKHF